MKLKLNGKEDLAFFWFTGNVFTVGKYFKDKFSILCEPNLPGEFWPCQTEFMGDFWHYICVWNFSLLILYGTWELVERSIIARKR